MIKKILILITGNIKLLILKLFHFNNLKYNFYNNVCINSEIEIRKKGRICLGKKFIMRRNCRLSSNGGRIEVGNNSGFNNNCYIVSHELIKIGNNVEIGPNCVIVDHDHDYNKEFAEKGKKRHFKTKPIIIGNNVLIGANSVILKGTKIGDNCVIGANTLVQGEYSNNLIIVQKRIDNIKTSNTGDFNE